MLFLFVQFFVGEFDFIQMMRLVDIVEVEVWDDLQVLMYDQRQYIFIIWNIGNLLFEDVMVCNVFILGIDCLVIVEILWFGYVNFGILFVFSLMWVVYFDIGFFFYDLEQVVQLFDEVGWIDSDGDGVCDKDGFDFSFELVINVGNFLCWDIIQMVQVQFVRIGIEVKLVCYDVVMINVWIQVYDFEVVIIGLLIDMMFDQMVMFKSDVIFNFGQYMDMEMDQFFDEFVVMIDKGVVIDKIYCIQEIFYCDQLMIVFWELFGICGLFVDLENVMFLLSSDFWQFYYWEWLQD